MLRRILVGLDGSPLAEAILDPVRTLARRLGAEIVLLHVIHVPETIRAAGAGPKLDDVVAQEQTRARAYLADVARKIGESGLSIASAISVGDAAAEIVRYAERQHVDLIALATHGRSGMQRWLHGSVADAVLHTAVTPLLMLRPSGARAVAPGLRRLVVPLDGSPLAETALPVAEELARALAAPIVLLRVVEFFGLAFGSDPFGGAYVDFESILGLLRDDAERYLAGVAGRLREKGLTVETLSPIGIAVDTITAQARDHPGTVLVLSTHGRTGWRGLVLGSVARRVVPLATGPVLVVPAARTPTGR